MPGRAVGHRGAARGLFRVAGVGLGGLRAGLAYPRGAGEVDDGRAAQVLRAGRPLDAPPKAEREARFIFERMAPLGQEAPVLFQLPPNLHLNIDRLASFIGWLPRHRRCTFEFRHPSWYAAEVFDLLANHDLALCISDLPEMARIVRQYDLGVLIDAAEPDSIARAINFISACLPFSLTCRGKALAKNCSKRPRKKRGSKSAPASS